MKPRARTLYDKYSRHRLAEMCADLEEILKAYAVKDEWLGGVTVFLDTGTDDEVEFDYDLPANCIFQTTDENGWELAQKALERIIR